MRSLTAMFSAFSLCAALGGGALSAAEAAALPDVPKGITSFGGAVVGDSVYVYGGNWGAAHGYTKDGQSTEFLRLDLKNPKAWEVLDNGPRRTGVTLVAHGDKLYRVGGFEANNAEGEKQSLTSVADAAIWDTKAGKWEALPPLPEARSSHDAIVLGDTLYVVGGWRLGGGEESAWHQTALKLDLTKSPLQWQPIAAPPFQRRALSVATFGKRLFVIGGMQAKGGPTTAVAVYDPAKNEWSEGPALPGKPMDGFGTSSFEHDGHLYVSVMSGKVFRLAGDEKSWEPVHELEQPRFFHRMLSTDQGLVFVGGASMESGKATKVERFQPSK